MVRWVMAVLVVGSPLMFPAWLDAQGLRGWELRADRDIELPSIRADENGKDAWRGVLQGRGAPVSLYRRDCSNGACGLEQRDDQRSRDTGRTESEPETTSEEESEPQ